MELRLIAERLSRKIVLRRRLPRNFGGQRLYVSPSGGGLRYWRHNLYKVDPHLFRLVDEFVKPGSVVWDLGANMGLFTFAAAHRAGETGFVLAIDGDVDNVSLLLRSRFARKQAGTAEVQVLPVAIGPPGSRFINFTVSERCRATNSIEGFGHDQIGPSREKRAVPLVTADELLQSFRPPNFVKIDVEGAEMEVFKGAHRLLSEARPIIEVEVAPTPEKQTPIRDLFLQHRYKLYNGADPAGQRKPTEMPTFSCLAVPE